MAALEGLLDPSAYSHRPDAVELRRYDEDATRDPRNEERLLARRGRRQADRGHEGVAVVGVR